MADSHVIPGFSGLSPRVRAYIEAIVCTCSDEGRRLVSLIAFGSATVGGWSEAVSDVDLILVVPDRATSEHKRCLRDEVERLEFVHGFGGVGGAARSRRVLETFMESVAATVRSFFICTRSDPLSGNIGRILDIRAFQAVFVDRIVLANILASAVTIWGEDLLSRVSVKSIRRFDVLKAWFGLFGQVLLSAAFFPLVPGSTEYAAAALKRSVHNCFFVYELRRASIEEEVGFFPRRLGSSRTLTELLALRRKQQRSLAFVIRCLPTLVRLHVRTAMDNTFPRGLPKALIGVANLAAAARGQRNRQPGAHNPGHP